MAWFHGRVLVLSVGAAALLLSGALAVGVARGVGDSPFGAADAGFEIAADFTLPAFDGEPITLSQYAGGPIFVYFWASWCGPCVREAPLIERLWPEFAAAGYTFVGVNVLDRDTDARAFIEQFGLTFPMAAGGRSQIYVEYGVYGLPEGFFLHPGMVVSQKFIGELTEDRFREMLARIEPEG